MLGAMASQFDDEDGALAAQMEELKQALSVRDSVIAGEHKKVADMQEGAEEGAPSPAQLLEIQKQLSSVEQELAATEQALASEEGKEAVQLLAATMPKWAPAVIPGALGQAQSQPAADESAPAAAPPPVEPEPEPEPEPAEDGDAVAGEANGYG